MDSKARAEIREALRDLVRDMLTAPALQCTVKSVDKVAGTIVATSLQEGLDYFNVRLKAVVQDGNGRGVLAYPVLGSQVTVAFLDGLDTMGYVAQLSDIEELRLTVDNGVSVSLLADGTLHLNGDALGGVVQVGELVKRLNKLERRMTSHQHFWGPPNAPVLTVPDPASNPPILPTLKTDLENPNVKHG